MNRPAVVLRQAHLPSRSSAICRHHVNQLCAIRSRSGQQDAAHHTQISRASSGSCQQQKLRHAQVLLDCLKITAGSMFNTRSRGLSAWRTASAVLQISVLDLPGLSPASRGKDACPALSPFSLGRGLARVHHKLLAWLALVRICSRCISLNKGPIVNTNVVMRTT